MGVKTFLSNKIKNTAIYERILHAVKRIEHSNGRVKRQIEACVASTNTIRNMLSQYKTQNIPSDSYQNNSGQKPMVLFISQNDRAGGAAQITFELYSGMKHHVNCSMICKSKSTKDNNIFSIPTDYAVQYQENVISRVLEQTQFAIDFTFSVQNEDTQVDIMPLISWIQPNIIHIHWLGNNFLSIETLEHIHELGISIVWTLHDMNMFTGGCHYSWAFGESYEFCDKYTSHCGNCPYITDNKEQDITYIQFERKQHIFRKINLNVVTPSKWMAEAAKRSVVCKDTSIVTIANGIDTNIFTPHDMGESRICHGLPLDKILILFGATYFSRIKGSHLLSRILKSLAIDVQEMALVTFGVDADKDATEDIAGYTVYPIGRIGFAGRTLLASLCSACDVFLAPSVQDNFPTTVLESMACGTPVVAFDAFGMKEQIVHKETGYLATPYSTEDMARGIEWILQQDEHDAHVMRQNARERVMKHFSKEIMIENYVKLYDTLLQNKGIGTQLQGAGTADDHLH